MEERSIGADGVPGGALIFHYPNTPCVGIFFEPASPPAVALPAKSESDRSKGELDNALLDLTAPAREITEQPVEVLQPLK